MNVSINFIGPVHQDSVRIFLLKSPVTGREMKVMVKKDWIDFRKERFNILFHYYEDEGSDEVFTDEELDTLNLNQAYNQYREKYRIPFPDAIRSIREKYGLSAAKMSEVLGFGTNIYRQYEAGEVPSISNARLIDNIENGRLTMPLRICISIGGEYAALLIHCLHRPDKLTISCRIDHRQVNAPYQLRKPGYGFIKQGPVDPESLHRCLPLQYLKNLHSIYHRLGIGRGKRRPAEYDDVLRCMRIKPCIVCRAH